MLIKIIYYENEIKGKFMFIKMIKIKWIDIYQYHLKKFTRDNWRNNKDFYAHTSSCQHSKLCYKAHQIYVRL